jgi:high-affinity iron transporter
VSFTNGEVKIPLAQVSDGDLHRFQAKENGVEVRFWLYQKPDGKMATVLDACEICGAVGFYKTANGVVCKNCAAPINPQSVGTAGGCNPIPLKATQTADSVIIQEADIAAGSRCSRNSKECSSASSTNPSGARSGANCWPARPLPWA